MSVDKKNKLGFRKDLVKLFLGGLLGYSFFWLTSHPTKSPVRKKLPSKKIKNIHILPEIHIEAKGKKYHMHHWLNMSFLYVLFLTTLKKHKITSRIMHGFMIGSIIQGLSYKDRFRFIHFLEDKWDKLALDN